MKRCFFVFLCALTIAGGAVAGESLSFVKASSELDDGRPRSYVYNLVDGKPETSWCAKADDAEPVIVFGFKNKVKLKKITIVAGSLKGAAFDPGKRSVKILGVNDGSVMREIKLTDDQGEQSITLNPPAEATQFSVRILGSSGAEGKPVCIGELGLGGYSGKGVGSAVRGLSTPSRKLVQRWVDAPDAPERTLLLSLDGTFVYRYEPFLEGEPVTLKGNWRGGTKNLRLEVGSKTFSLKSKLTRIDDGESQSVQLSLKGKPPHPSLLADYSPAPTPGL